MKNKNILFEFCLMLLGTFLFAFSINNFIIPFGLGEGGVTGITIISYYVYEIPTWIPNLLINALIIIFGYKLLSKKTLIYTVFCTVLLSVFLKYIPSDVFILNDLLIAAIASGFVSGLGLALVIVGNGSTAGSSLISLIMNKKFNWNISYGMLFFDVIVVLLGSFIIGFEKTIYTIIMLYICTKVMNLIIEYNDNNKTVLVISDKYDDIGSYVTNTLNRGVTLLEGKGFYTKDDKKILLIIVKNSEFKSLKKEIRKIDNLALVNLQSDSITFGKGFNKI